MIADRFGVDEVNLRSLCSSHREMGDRSRLEESESHPLQQAEVELLTQLRELDKGLLLFWSERGDLSRRGELVR